MSSTSDPAATPAGRRPRPGRETVRTLTVGGRTLRVAERTGDGSRPPLVLMNGIGASLEVLQPFVDALDPRRTVVRFDVPGVGGSPPPVVPYVLATLTPVVSSLLRRLGHEDEVDVLGLSWGGGLAQHFAVQHRRRCRKLVLAATGTGSLMVPAHPRVLSHMLTPRRHRDAGYATRVAGELYGGTVRSDPERAARALHAHSRLGPRRGYYYQLAASAGWSSLPFLSLIRQPTLVVAGDDDPIIPSVNARILARGIPRARLHLYGGGHLALVTEADELAPVVDAFLDEP
ncbi:poly(3-hydroxyalkanoate) depolymerase [Geodermatophilus telluris]|uniref:Poly(3-hydroxyalkanoate) depolymerase n=1 Tax=Geodermatophilus telluris TaxID=1190417 RepID=A0A1G6J9X7_9ACTN|nr:poly(3-hydroxyalkanoate) depolymerase [Geodermatophilus telluris]SDC15682.1 poly(3-hydroxyalkanoate) depolymerase [Geodermatophilus telluris]